MITVTRLDAEVLPRIRRELIRVAQNHTLITYGELVNRAALPHSPRALGRLLGLISEDCAHRGEPTLAALVVSKSTGEVGASFQGDPQQSRTLAWRFHAR